MFQHTQFRFGNYEVIRLFHEEKGVGFEVIPSFGARLNSLKVATPLESAIEVIDGFSSEEELVKDTIYKSAILFPFPNRLRDGKFSSDGATYHFPINERERNNAIHGFMADRPFEITHIQTSEEDAEIKLRYTQEEGLRFYPFTFVFDITYKLDTSSRFEVAIDITNTGENVLPFGLGWHPYFTFPHWHGVKLRICEADQIELDERALPSGRLVSYSALSAYAAVDEVKLDDCFLIKSKSQNIIAHLQNGSARLAVWRDASTIPYLQVYTPPGNSIAIEPMTCNVDALNNKMGLINLAPKSVYSTSFGVSAN